ncbi:hypothetical protein [Streptomyces sp. NPDC052693]|uniref:hypothetical protein n=1 Tax=Streptomyces sp. NPDC052693 TaxID=3155814 RepID=UPI003419B571
MSRERANTARSAYETLAPDAPPEPAPASHPDAPGRHPASHPAHPDRPDHSDRPHRQPAEAGTTPAP